MDGKLGDNHSGELARETAEQKANRIIPRSLRRGWQESDLATRHRSDPGKLAIAARLRNETTLPIKWIAARVNIGTAKGAKSVLHRLATHQPPGTRIDAHNWNSNLRFDERTKSPSERARTPFLSAKKARLWPENRSFRLEFGVSGPQN